MKNTSNALRRVMSVVLVFAMMFTSMPTGALAEDVVDPAPSTTAAEPAASETTEPTTPEPASSEAAPAANSAVLPANDGDPAPVTFTVTFVANGETLVTQTIQQGGSAVAPDAPLVSGQRFVRWDTDFTNVQSDLTVTAVYEAITAKNMTVEYRYSDGTQAAPSHVEQAVVGEPFHKTVPSPALDGFTPDKAEVVFAVESVTEDLTVVVTYSGAARNYTVKHLFQNVEGTAYAEDEALRETLEGTTGLDTAAQAKTVEGFTALPITQVKVASSGETVVEVKYDRNSYLLTWNTDGGSYIEPQMLKYGAAVSAPADPTKVGYTFAGWDFVPETMPAAATTVTAQWANATQASYQVVYWGENLTGGYDYLYADKETGAVGDDIPYSTSLTGSRMPQGLEAAGFELDSAKSAGNVEITADGSAVKNVYFSRRTFTISFYRYSKRQWREDTSLRITAKYGEDVSARWETACEDDGWGPNKNDNIQYTLIANMPAENLTMYEKSSGTGTTIEYRVEKINGSGYDVYATFKASSGVHLTDEDKMPITGFAYDSWKQYTNGWGDSTLWLYYTRNSYNLVFENCTGVSPRALKFEAPLSGAKPADSSVGRPAGMDSDYVFMGWYLDPGYQTEVDWSSTMPARNLQVYAKWAKPDYTVSFNTHGADTETPAPIGVAKYDTIEDQMPADPTREGYVFAGWYTDEAYTVPFVATQQIVRNLTLHAKWTRTDSCTYVIVAKDTEGNELKRVDGSEVEVGASVTVNAPVIDGYQAQQSSQNVKILDDGQEVVFVYDKLQNWTATVHHYIEGTTEKVAEDVIRSDLTVNSLLVYSATVSGYELAEGTSYVQTATRENSEITFYYKKIADSAYTVNHYYGSNVSLTETVTGTAKAGSLVTADVINKAGYTCVTSGAALSAYVAKDGSTVINVYYAANDQTYSVYYYLEGTETPVPGTTAKENVSAKFDETVTETAPAVTGYTVAGDSTRSITVGADNAANKIVFYYTVNSYPLNITYKYADDVPDAALRGQKAAEPVSRDIAFGAPYSVASPLIPGYTASVAAVAGTMAENGVTVEVVYRAATDTAYTVKHMLQDVTGDGYTEDAAARQTLHGTTGADTNAAAKSYEGFTAQAVVQQAIAADGSTVVEIKYDRNSYEVTYAYVGTAPAGASALPEKATVKYGAPVAVAAAATAPGYTFSGWSREDGFTMPAENVTITGSFTANGETPYKVEHYQQNLEDDGYTLAETENLTGETDTTATANPKTYTGFAFDGTAEGTVASGNIAGDGSLVLKLYYTRNSYDVTYAYTGTVPTGASALPEKATVKYGAPVTVAEAATAPGYTFSGWSRNDFTMPAENVTITGSFTANSNTEYTVRHHFQNILDDAYDADTAMLSETLSGTTDTLTAAAAKTVAGFTAQSFQQKNIAGDGSTVVDIYYNRNSYGVSYRYLNTPAGASALPAGASYRFGAAVTVAEAATAPGYTFSGWSTGDFTMPAQDVEITGSFTANGDTAYTVEHYQQNLAGDGYDLVEADTEHLTGETDTTATANPKAYTGFTFDGTVEGTVASGNIAGDGSLVLKLYYTRNSYDVTYAYTGTVPADASALPEKAAVKYGASVTVAEAATAKGHTFSGWSTGDFTMPAQDVEITGSFTANPYNVTVEYYFDKVQDTDMTRVQSVTYGETFTTAAAAETDRNGVHYTLDWVENNGLTVSDIEADNVVRVYYAKDEEGGPDDIPDYAQIVFTYQSADVRKGTVDKSVEIHTFERLNGELLEEKKASPAGANAAGREGYAFDYWTDGTKRDVTSGMETLKSEVYTDNAEFTAYFDVDTKGTDPENPDKPDNVPDKYQAKVTYQAVNGAVTLGGSTGTELVTYVTLFDADGKWAENGTGKLAEAQVPTAAAAADYDPATERWTPAVPAEGAEITADGAVFTVTWELAISGYQVHYYYDGVEDTASAVNATGKIGDAIPYDTGKTTFDGANYVLENVDGAGKLISKDAAANIVNVNFTKDEKSDPTKDPDPEVPGDNIPDKYQATVTFEAINGVLQPKGGTDAQNTKQMTTVVTLLNENGEPAENGTGYLTEAQIPTALANLGYIANTLFWGPATPTTSYAITGDITFVADFNAEGVIPEEPPVPPVTPVGPTAPEEGPEETIDEPETPLAPAEPEAPAEEPAEEEIEEADTPLASGAAWALLNLILMLCTALVSILLLIGFLGKKKKEDENENVEYTVKRKGVTRVLSLIPAIGSIIAFLLTENMRNPMVFVDRWTWLMVLIALVQVIVCIFARKEKEVRGRRVAILQRLCQRVKTSGAHGIQRIPGRARLQAFHLAFGGVDGGQSVAYAFRTAQFTRQFPQQSSQLRGFGGLRVQRCGALVHLLRLLHHFGMKRFLRPDGLRLWVGNQEAHAHQRRARQRTDPGQPGRLQGHLARGFQGFEAAERIFSLQARHVVQHNRRQ